MIRGQKIWTSRALHSDLMILLARTTPLEAASKPSEGLSVFLIDMVAARDRLDIRPIRTMFNHATTEVFLDDVARACGRARSARRARASATSSTA